MGEFQASESAGHRITSLYLAFAEREARGRSLLYEELARGVASDPAMLAFLARLPRVKQQPNLLFAVVKYLYGTTNNWEHFRCLIHEHADEVGALMMTRSTQTNEPARCATLLPVLARLPPPLALLEVGAAAGLCLLPDCYAYDYDGHRIAPRSLVSAAAPTFSCCKNEAPLPVSGLEIVWRAGLDLTPIDINERDQVAWLEALVWPDEGNRLELLRAALEVARQNPPQVFQGDLRTDLQALIAEAPTEATLVVFHTAVLGYVTSADERSAFAQTVKDRGVVWISNEPPGLFPETTVGLNKPWPPGQFLLAMDGSPIAWTDPHGTSLDWIAEL